MATQTAKAKKKPAAKKINTYAWSGKDKNGKTLKGEVNAADLNAARALIKKQGVMANKVRKKSKPRLMQTAQR